MAEISVKQVANQKIFVPLSAVTKIQADFARLRSEASPMSPTTQNYLRGMAAVIKELGLPINLPIGY